MENQQRAAEILSLIQMLTVMVGTILRKPADSLPIVVRREDRCAGIFSHAAENHPHERHHYKRGIKRETRLNIRRHYAQYRKADRAQQNAYQPRVGLALAGQIRRREDRAAVDLDVATIGATTIVLKGPYLRMSYQSKRKVSDILGEAFPNTLLLAAVSISIAMLLGLIIGILTAVINTKFLNKLTLFITTIGMSLPSFFAAILMAWIFGFLLEHHTGLSMTGSLYTVDEYGRGEFLSLRNLILPALTLGMRPLAVVTELTRTSLLEAMSMDYVRTARAKGLKPWRVICVHALRNALNPVVTAVSGWFASLLAGAVFVEYVFDWKGIGVVVVDALDKYDFPVIMGAVLLIAVMLIIVNIVVDIIYGIIDPRVRIS